MAMQLVIYLLLQVNPETDKSTGQKQERTEWHRVSLFGKLAEIAGQYLDKGSKVLCRRKITDSEMARPEWSRSLHYRGCR